MISLEHSVVGSSPIRYGSPRRIEAAESLVHRGLTEMTMDAAANRKVFKANNAHHG
jgi:hypothetical protein